MKKLSILLIAMFAFSGLAFSGVAGASTAAKPAASCAAVLKQFSSVKGLGSSSASDPKSLSKQYKKAAQIYDKLAKSGPKALRPSFKRIEKVVASLQHINFNDASSIAKYESSVSGMTKDLTKIENYFATCTH